MRFFVSVKQAASEFLADDCMSRGAAIAYYAIFALPPLLVMMFIIAGFVGISPRQINRALMHQVGIPTGAAEEDAVDKSPESSRALTNDSQLLSIAEQERSSKLGGVGIFGRIVSVLLLVFAATGLFSQLQFALNRAWNVESEKGGIKRYVIKRVLSLAMIGIIALLLLISMVASSLLTHFISFLQGTDSQLLVKTLAIVSDNVLTLCLGTLFLQRFSRYSQTLKLHGEKRGSALGRQPDYL